MFERRKNNIDRLAALTTSLDKVEKVTVSHSWLNGIA